MDETSHITCTHIHLSLPSLLTQSIHNTTAPTPTLHNPLDDMRMCNFAADAAPGIRFFSASGTVSAIPQLRHQTLDFLFRGRFRA